jgi:hypothetical protein
MSQKILVMGAPGHEINVAVDREDWMRRKIKCTCKKPYLSAKEYEWFHPTRKTERNFTSIKITCMNCGLFHSWQSRKNFNIIHGNNP